MKADDGNEAPDLSSSAVTARLKRMSQLRALCLSLAEAGRRAGLHERSTADLNRRPPNSSGQPPAAE
ncbi:MAG: hypothetical protein OXJ90_19430 [Spirochaetaceae bacterium]|nr:hypothetical protein [Spirochaetaceae bacterium]